MSAIQTHLARCGGRQGMRQLSLLGFLSLALSTLLVVAVASVAHARDDSLYFRLVDTTAVTAEKSATNNVTMVLRVPYSSSASGSTSVMENDRQIAKITEQTAQQADLPATTMFIVDGGVDFLPDRMNATKRALHAYVDAARTNEQIGIISTGFSGTTASPITTDKGSLAQSIDGLKSDDKAAGNWLWASSQKAAEMLRNRGQGVANVVIITAGEGDNNSVDTAFGDARQALIGESASVFVVAEAGKNAMMTSSLRDIASSTRGEFTSAKLGSEVESAIAKVQNSLANQRVVQYVTAPRSADKLPAALNITVKIGSAQSAATVNTGQRLESDALRTTAQARSESKLVPKALQLWIPLLASLFAIAVIAFVGFQLYNTKSHSLRSALSPYSDDIDEKRDFSKLADSAFVQKAVEATAKAAEERGVLQGIETRLAQADLPVKPAETLLGAGILAIIGIVVGYILASFFGAVIAALLVAVLPFLVVNFLAARRRRKFNAQLPDILQLLSGSLRAGYSFLQGVDAVAKQAEAPMASELTRAISEARLGKPIEESLDDVAKRMGSDDFGWAVMAVRIQREVGGNLAELLMTVAETMIARERLRREVRALTAEGRMSAIILCILPFAIGGAIFALNPGYIMPFVQNIIGQAMFVLAIVMIIVGYIIMNKLIQIEA